MYIRKRWVLVKRFQSNLIQTWVCSKSAEDAIQTSRRLPQAILVPELPDFLLSRFKGLFPKSSGRMWIFDSEGVTSCHRERKKSRERDSESERRVLCQQLGMKWSVCNILTTTGFPITLFGAVGLSEIYQSFLTTWDLPVGPATMFPKSPKCLTASSLSPCCIWNGL